MVEEGAREAPSPNTFNIAKRAHFVNSMDVLKEITMIAIAIIGGHVLGSLYRRHKEKRSK